MESTLFHIKNTLINLIKMHIFMGKVNVLKIKIKKCTQMKKANLQVKH